MFQFWSFGECGVPPSFPLLPGLLWPGVVVPSLGQIELFNHLIVYKQMTSVKLNY